MTRVLMAALLLASSGCGEDAVDEAGRLEPAAIGDSECAACGMIVRDQPAPRGQLVHRDGTRVYFCAIADLVTYVAAPSPHGSPRAIYVEIMSSDADPGDRDTRELTWSLVEDAGFVFGGFERPVMGEPVLTFANMDEARAAARRLDARAVTWAELREALGDDGRAHAH